MSLVEELIEDTYLNAVISWILILGLGLIAADNFLADSLLFGGFSLFVILISVLPALVFRDPRAMVPWEILALAAIPFVAETVISGFPTDYFTYLSTAGVAMIVVVELHFFTELRMNDFFAVLFVAIVTIASAGVWALARWLSDIHLGTNFALEHDPLMWEFVMATFSGVAAGFIFDLYFKHLVSSDIFEEVVE